LVREAPSNQEDDMLKWISIVLAIAVLPACGDNGLNPHEGYVDVEGGRVWYRIAGSGNETPLILLHGGPGAPSYYLNPLEGVTVDRPVIFYDQLGAGRSDRPTDTSLWTVDRFVRELDDIREALGLDEVHILGHSWGSMLAVDYMLTKPEGVQSLILASPALSVRRWAEDADRLVAQLPEELQRNIEKHEASHTTDDPEYQEATMEYYKRYLSRSDPWSPDLLLAFENFNSDIYGLMWGPSEFTATGTLKDYEREDVLPNLDLPVLFTAGRYDEATPETVEIYQSLVPGSKIAIFENSAHMTMLDEPEAYTDVVREFLNEVDSNR
jgi:proline-specific peptidase